MDRASLSTTLKHYTRPQIADVSDDIIVRITLSEKLLPIKISLENVNAWMNEAVKAEKNHNVKKAYMAFVNNVKIFYEKLGNLLLPLTGLIGTTAGTKFWNQG